MPDSMFASLLNTLDSKAIGEVAQTLGQPAQSVSKGLESSIAALLGGLTAKSNDPTTLQRIIDTVPSTAGPVSWSQLASGVAAPNSPLLAAGASLLPALFGSGGNAVTNAISRAAGMSSGSITTLLTMAAPMVIGFIGRHVRDTGMSMSGLGKLLQGESATIRKALPAGLSEVFWPGTAAMGAAASPVVAQTVQREASSNWLLPALAVGALALGAMWLFSHARRPVIEPRASIPMGEANRLAIPPVNAGCNLPASVTLAEGGLGSRLLALVQDPSAKLDGTTWLNIDELTFPTGSAQLKTGSRTELDNVAVILANCPNVGLMVAGYTDNVGSADSNLRLSRNRANAVVAQLVAKGVSSNRLAAEGYGEEDPVADNATGAGRAQNRRVSIRVTKK
jgi:OmpA-OmpF porin, OOP family